MIFGNWSVDEGTITWKGSGAQQLVIPADQLGLTKAEAGSDDRMYEWIITATNEDWLTQNDLYDLNYAFVYAFAKSGLDFNYDIFDTTLAYQFEVFDAEDSQDLDL